MYWHGAVWQGSLRFNLMEDVLPPTLFLSCCNYSMTEHIYFTCTFLFCLFTSHRDLGFCYITVFVLYRITVLRTHCGEAPGRDSNQGGLKRQGHWPLTTLYSTAQNTGHWQSKKIEHIHTVGIQSYDVATNTTQSTHTIYTSRAENVLTMLWTHAVKDTIQL